jgi:hypothetical protein
MLARSMGQSETAAHPAAAAAFAAYCQNIACAACAASRQVLRSSAALQRCHTCMTSPVVEPAYVLLVNHQAPELALQVALLHILWPQLVVGPAAARARCTCVVEWFACWCDLL